MTTRRDELAEAATDYALGHGLIGLSLRPLAESIGTSDRMLLYHVRAKDDLVVTTRRTTNPRSVTSIEALPPSADLRTAVVDLWREVSSGDQQRCQRLYVEAAALGLLGQEPYATGVGESNAAWMAGVADFFTRSGVGRADAKRVAMIVDATFMGLLIDQPLVPAARQRRSVEELAHAVMAVWGQPGKA
jgi:AcrR family transcriptional regulator